MSDNASAPDIARRVLGLVWAHPRLMLLAGFAASLSAASLVLGSGEGVSPFLHLSACLGGQPLPGGATPAAHCGWCWSALTCLALAIGWPPKAQLDTAQSVPTA